MTVETAIVGIEKNIDAPSSPVVSAEIKTNRAKHSILSTNFVIWISIATLLAILAWPMLVGQVYTADDLGEFHLPLRDFYSRQLSRGEGFDWCPELYCGFYLIGEGQAGTYHPLHWL